MSDSPTAVASSTSSSSMKSESNIPSLGAKDVGLPLEVEEEKKGQPSGDDSFNSTPSSSSSSSSALAEAAILASTSSCCTGGCPFTSLLVSAPRYMMPLVDSISALVSVQYPLSIAITIASGLMLLRGNWLDDKGREVAGAHSFVTLSCGLNLYFVLLNLFVLPFRRASEKSSTMEVTTSDSNSSVIAGRSCIVVIAFELVSYLWLLSMSPSFASCCGGGFLQRYSRTLLTIHLGYLVVILAAAAGYAKKLGYIDMAQEKLQDPAFYAHLRYRINEQLANMPSVSEMIAKVSGRTPPPAAPEQPKSKCPFASFAPAGARCPVSGLTNDTKKEEDATSTSSASSSSSSSSSSLSSTSSSCPTASSASSSSCSTGGCSMCPYTMGMKLIGMSLRFLLCSLTALFNLISRLVSEHKRGAPSSPSRLSSSSIAAARKLSERNASFSLSSASSYPLPPSPAATAADVPAEVAPALVDDLIPVSSASSSSTIPASASSSSLSPEEEFVMVDNN